MPNVSRHIVNAAWKAYRKHHLKYKEFDCGYVDYRKFLGVEENEFRSWAVTLSEELFLTDLGLSKLNIIANCSPELHYILLKAAVLRHKK